MQLQKEQRQKSENYIPNTDATSMSPAPLKKKHKRKSEKISSISDISSKNDSSSICSTLELTSNQSNIPPESTLLSSSINIQQNFNSVKNNSTNDADILSI
jgi:hypothetical protein